MPKVSRSDMNCVDESLRTEAQREKQHRVKFMNKLTFHWSMVLGSSENSIFHNITVAATIFFSGFCAPPFSGFLTEFEQEASWTQTPYMPPWQVSHWPLLATRDNYKQIIEFFICGTMPSKYLMMKKASLICQIEGSLWEVHLGT